MKLLRYLRGALAVLNAVLLGAVPIAYKTVRTKVRSNSSDISAATVFTLSQRGIEVSQGEHTGYMIEGNKLEIESAGTYVLKGSSPDASVKVKKETKGVILVLDGLELASQNTAPIVCAKSSEVTIIAAKGSVNTLSDTEMNNDETHAENIDAENAVIKCKDGSKVILAGEGTLNIVANGKNGIKGGASTETEGESSLTVRELTLNINAPVNDALKADTLLNIESGNIIIEAADDGIKSDYTLNIGIKDGEGPRIKIVSSMEGIEAATINVYSGDIEVNSKDDGINAANSDIRNYSFECNFYGGKVIVNTTEGDGIDSNGKINLAGGILEVYSSTTRRDNSPLDSDGELILTSGTVLGIGVPGMGERPTKVEQAYVMFGSSGMGGRGEFQGGRGAFQGGRGAFHGENAPPQLSHGPEADPNATTDTQSGATQQHHVIPDGGRNDGANAKDSFFGAAGMSSNINISEGDKLEIVDQSGNTLYSATSKRSASYVFLSSDALKEGETYSLLVNGETAASVQASMTVSNAAGAWQGGGRVGGSRDVNSAENGTQPGSAQKSVEADAADMEGQVSNNESSEANASSRTIMLVLAAAGIVALSLVAVLITVRAKGDKYFEHKAE